LVSYELNLLGKNMGQTMTEKLYAAHTESGAAKAGDIVMVSPDVVLINDVSGTITIEQLERMQEAGPRYPDRVVLVADHFSPAKDIISAQSIRLLRQFGRQFGIEHYYDAGNGGIEHTLLPEIGMIGPGGIVFGADSHTCTAGAFNASGMGFGSTDLAAAMALGELWVKVPESMRIDIVGSPRPYVTGKDIILSLIAAIGSDGASNLSIEFGGPGLCHLNVDERMAVANMAVEAGAETCVFEADEQVHAFAAAHGWQARSAVAPDPDAHYQSTRVIDLDALEPLVAVPPSPANGTVLSKLVGTKVDQVYIGNCSNGTLTDLRQAASILRGRKVSRDVRVIIVPATNAIYREAAAEGLLEVFAAAGAAVSLPTCGACFGGHMGVLAEGETAIATTNRNFKGRMGHPNSRVYLSNAWVAAAAAVNGEIVDPSMLAVI
jgi:3-isopropylmalate/(R)-2-methylmalate dehydratase large subunit